MGALSVWKLLHDMYLIKFAFLLCNLVIILDSLLQIRKDLSEFFATNLHEVDKVSM